MVLIEELEKKLDTLNSNTTDTKQLIDLLYNGDIPTEYWDVFFEYIYEDEDRILMFEEELLRRTLLDSIISIGRKN